MGTWTVRFSPRARRQFDTLEPDTQRRLAPVIDALAANPRPPSCKRLVADEALYRIRVGPYRIVYLIEDARLVVLVIKLGHRRDVYRDK